MKHIDELEAELRLLLEAVDPPSNLSEQSVRLMAAHLRFVLVANERVNLTAIRSPEEGLRLHVIDSLLALPEVEQSPDGPMLDIGSGGGFPGIPLALASGRRTTLMDSVSKKMTIVGEFLSESGLASQISTTAARAEKLGEEPAAYMVVTARAVSELPALVELSSPLLLESGRLIAMKARLSGEELKRGDRVAAQCGMRRIGIRELTLPGGDEQRRIIVYERRGASRVRLPRREGLAQHKPLA